MRRLRRGRAARLCDERGAVAVMVALFMVPLLGVAAIAVDVGALHADRAQLRNAADAAALAIAADCARGSCGSTVATATSLASENFAADDAVLGAPTVAVSGTRVTVTVTARQSHWFAPVLGANSSQVSATAVAESQGVATATGALPLAVATCQYAQLTSGGLTDRTVRKLVTGGAPCLSPRGKPLPGGFGWLDTDATGGCQVTATVGAQVGSDTGNTLPNACKRTGHLDGLVNTTVLLPIFDEAGGQGNNGWYRVQGWAAFHLTGYSFDNKHNENGAACGKDSCLLGYFTSAVAPTTGGLPPASGAPDLGVRSVRLTG